MIPGFGVFELIRFSKRMCDSWIANSHHKIGERLSDADDVGDDDEVDIGGLAVDESDEKEGEY